MKKLLLLLMLIISFATSAQTFIKHYDHVIKTDRVNGSVSPWQQTDITVIFSGNDKGDIIIYTNTGLVNHADRYTKIGTILNGKAKDGATYRYIETRNEKQEKIIMQLFDGSGTFRVHSAGATFEYQEPVK
jgi:hypothetical protein